MRAVMANKQLVYLFLISFSVLFVGIGVFPLLPLYAGELGATTTVVGFYFALIYLANAFGPVVTAALADRVSKKKMLIAVSALSTPALALMGQATTLWQLIALSAVIWFAGGLIMALVGIFTGLNSDERSRGKSFSLMALAGPLGSLVGGGTAGLLLAGQGYAGVFLAMAAVWATIPLIGHFALIEPARAAQPLAAVSRNTPRRGWTFGANYAALLGVTLLASMTVNVSRLGTPYSMQALGFTADAVSSATMISGLAAIPVILSVGALSDRLGRKHFLALAYLMVVGGALIQGAASQLWHFWAASTLLLLAFGINGAMGSALTGELLPARSLGQGLSVYNLVSSVASILCYVIGGFVIDALGLHTLYLASALLAVSAAAALEIFVQRPARRQTLPKVSLNPQVCKVECY